MNLKKIKYDNVDYLCEYVYGNWFEMSGTYIYDSTPEIKYVKKYLFFGPLVKKISYNYLFTIDINIEDEYYSKSVIKKNFNHHVQKLERKKEIEKGEII